MTGRQPCSQLCRVRKRRLHFFMILWPDLPFLPFFSPCFLCYFHLLFLLFLLSITSFPSSSFLFFILKFLLFFFLISIFPSFHSLIFLLPSLFPNFLPSFFPWFRSRCFFLSVRDRLGLRLGFPTVQIISLSGKFQTCTMKNQIHPFIRRLSRTAGNKLEIKYIWNFWSD